MYCACICMYWVCIFMYCPHQSPIGFCPCLFSGLVTHLCVFSCIVHVLACIGNVLSRSIQTNTVHTWNTDCNRHNTDSMDREWIDMYWFVLDHEWHAWHWRWQYKHSKHVHTTHVKTYNTSQHLNTCNTHEYWLYIPRPAMHVHTINPNNICKIHLITDQLESKYKWIHPIHAICVNTLLHIHTYNVCNTLQYRLYANTDNFCPYLQYKQYMQIHINTDRTNSLHAIHTSTYQSIIHAGACSYMQIHENGCWCNTVTDQCIIQTLYSIQVQFGYVLVCIWLQIQPRSATEREKWLMLADSV